MRHRAHENSIANGIGFIGGQPPFLTGQLISAKLTIKNPTAKALTYNIRLSLGSNIIGSFAELTVQPGAQVDTAVLSGTAPATAGTYPVYLDVNAGGDDLPTMQAGTVVVNAPQPPETPDIDIVSVVWL